LTQYFNGRSALFEDETGDGIDGKGNAYPAELLPPDGTKELDGNPFLIGAPGPDLYPGDYYQLDDNAAQQPKERISYLFTNKIKNNMISSAGQKISLPTGVYTKIHILASAAPAQSAVPGEFSIVDANGNPISAPLDIAPWNGSNSKDQNVQAGTYSFWYPYLHKGTNQSVSSCGIGEYEILAPTGKKISSIILPKDSKIKIFAITLEK